MPEPIREEATAILRFGAGLHTRASEADIDPREAAAGSNFSLDLANQEMRARRAFDLVGQAPNGLEIRGFITLRQADGSVHLAVQAGDKVYDIDNLGDFTEIATVNSSARLRGRLEHNWTVDDKVLVTDLAGAVGVYEWDGGTTSGDFDTVIFTDEAGQPFGTFRAKYCQVVKERAIFANIYDGNAFPHLIVSSKRDDFTNITVANRPSSAIAEDDPWFLVQPDLRPINGMVEAFGQLAVSGDEGSIFKLTGETSEDFAMDELFPRLAARGDEAITWVGNDVFFGRAGRLESLQAVQRFGDVQQQELSIEISDAIEEVDSWLIAYNSRMNRAYFFPDGRSELYVYHRPLRGTDLSPWMRWTTGHSMEFRPTAAMNVLDPADGLEYVFMGDSDGNVYRLEGASGGSDGGTNEVTVTRTSKLIEAILDAQAFNVDGWVRYRHSSSENQEIALTFEYAGVNIFDRTVVIGIPSEAEAFYYGGEVFYGGNFFYGVGFAQRLRRRTFQAPGAGNEFQIRVSAPSAVEISEIGVRFTAAK